MDWVCGNPIILLNQWHDFKATQSLWLTNGLSLGFGVLFVQPMDYAWLDKVIGSPSPQWCDSVVTQSICPTNGVLWVDTNSLSNECHEFGATIHFVQPMVYIWGKLSVCSTNRLVRLHAVLQRSAAAWQKQCILVRNCPTLIGAAAALRSHVPSKYRESKTRPAT